MNNKTESFLIRQGLHSSCYDFETHVNDFINEMNAGLSGRESSLLMLPSYLGIFPPTPPEGDVIAIDAGGTYLRIALVHFEPGTTPTTERHAKYMLPGSDAPVNKDDFFSRLVEYIGDRTEVTSKVGFCFSFPSEIGADRDGRIIGFNKEVKVQGSAGCAIGAELNAAFLRAGKSPADVTVLNDSAAALLGNVFARSADETREYGGYIGLIYGTGVNICYYDPEKEMLINTETGGYGGFRQTACDIQIDKVSDNPGDHRFEKMVSGAYFSTVVLETIKLAANEGVFSAETCKAIHGLTQLGAISIDDFMRSGGAGSELRNLCACEKDALYMYDIFDGIYERAAKLLAISITATLKQSGASCEHPALTIAEGGAFHKGYKFRERFEKHIMAHASAGKTYELVLAEDDVIIGAAASVYL